MRTLYGLTQSAWTEKARWALEHHGIAYRYHEHVPVLGEVLLRLKARPRDADAEATSVMSPALVRPGDARHLGERHARRRVRGPRRLA